ncbi:hypothetical protein, partial [Hoeflea halophila]|uniref:hypothetical protein n=1 Tax=Hoeflea halophila TaxID=714899 RepID=UPI001AEFC410
RTGFREHVNSCRSSGSGLETQKAPVRALCVVSDLVAGARNTFGRLCTFVQNIALNRRTLTGPSKPI